MGWKGSSGAGYIDTEVAVDVVRFRVEILAGVVCSTAVLTSSAARIGSAFGLK